MTESSEPSVDKKFNTANLTALARCLTHHIKQRRHAFQPGEVEQQLRVRRELPRDIRNHHDPGGDGGLCNPPLASGPPECREGATSRRRDGNPHLQDDLAIFDSQGLANPQRGLAQQDEVTHTEEGQVPLNFGGWLICIVPGVREARTRIEERETGCVPVMEGDVPGSLSVRHVRHHPCEDLCAGVEGLCPLGGPEGRSTKSIVESFQGTRRGMPVDRGEFAWREDLREDGAVDVEDLQCLSAESRAGVSIVENAKIGSLVEENLDHLGAQLIPGTGDNQLEHGLVLTTG